MRRMAFVVAVVCGVFGCSPGTPGSDGGSGGGAGGGSGGGSGGDAGTGCTFTLSGAVTATGSCVISGAFGSTDNETYVFATHALSATEKGEYGIYLTGEAMTGAYTAATKGSLAIYKTGATWLKTAPLAFDLNLSDVRVRSESGGVKQLDLDGTLTFDVPAASGSLAGTATGTVTVQLTF